MVHSHSVAPYQPFELCSYNSLLMYQDMSGEPMEEVRCLCCFSSPPKMVDDCIVTGGVELQGMCCVRKPGTNETSVIISSFTNGVAAYEVTSNNLEWKLKGKLPDMKKEIRASGITTDGSDRVFVHNTRNACVHQEVKPNAK